MEEVASGVCNAAGHWAPGSPDGYFSSDPGMDTSMEPADMGCNMAALIAAGAGTMHSLVVGAAAVGAAA